MGETGSLSQGGDRGSQRKTELKGLRNQYLQEQAGQGVPIEDISTAFCLSEGHLKNNILSLGSYRRREKGEAPLNKLQINGIKLEFACMMGQKGYTIEQCNYMMNLTSEYSLERQEKQQELEFKLAKQEDKLAKLKSKAEAVVTDLQKQLQEKGKEAQSLSKDNQQKDSRIKSLEAAQKELQAKVEAAEEEAEIEALKKQLEDNESLYRDNMLAIKEATKKMLTEGMSANNELAKKLEDSEDEKKKLESEIQGLYDKIEDLQIEEPETEKLEAGVGKRKLTIQEEQKVMEILGRAGYKVTVLSLKRIKRAGIEISRQGVYGVLARFQESKSKC